jgi:hypothetical protein
MAVNSTELAQDHLQGQALVLIVLKLQILLPYNQKIHLFIVVSFQWTIPTST